MKEEPAEFSEEIDRKLLAKLKRWEIDERRWGIWGAPKEWWCSTPKKHKLLKFKTPHKIPKRLKTQINDWLEPRKTPKKKRR